MAKKQSSPRNSPDKVKVDIFLPCYNGSGTIYKTLESIQRQTFKSFRVVLVDNNSTDDSIKIFRRFQDSRFECIRFSDSVSLGDNFNRCLKYVQADYFCIMHTDDEYHENYLEVMLAAIEARPDVWLAHCNARIIDEHSKEKWSLKNFIKSKMSIDGEKGYGGCKGLMWIADYNKIIAPSVMYRRSVINDVGKFSSHLKFTLDWEYYFRTLKAGGVILSVNRVLLDYRVHFQQQTAALVASMDKYHEMFAMLNRIQAHIKKHYDIVKRNRFGFFFGTVLVDLLFDVRAMQFSLALKKLRFIVKMSR